MSLLASEATAAPPRLCLIDDCTHDAAGRGLCKTHYWQNRRDGKLDDFPIIRQSDPTFCSEPGCGGTARSRGLCQTHYHRARRAGKLTLVTPIPEQVEETAGQLARTLRDHITALGAAGVPVSAIPTLGYLPPRIVKQIADGTLTDVDADTATRILRIPVDYATVEDREFVTAIGTKRRIQALVVHGWTLGEIAMFLGLHQSVLSVILHPKTTAVTARTYRQVAAMYREREMTVPPAKSTRSVGRTRRDGWIGGLAWDDIDREVRPGKVHHLDEPTFDDVAVMRALEGERVTLRRADRVEIVKRAHQRRWSDQRIAQVTGIVDKTVFRIRTELGLPGWEMHELMEKTRDDWPAGE